MNLLTLKKGFYQVYLMNIFFFLLYVEMPKEKQLY